MSTALHEPPVGLPDGLGRVLAVLSATLDAGQRAELWQGTDRELTEAAVACGRLVSRTTALLTRVLGEVDARGLALRSGACSMTAWARHELNVTPREARTLVGVGTAVCGGLAVTGDAFAAGDLSLAQAAAITATVGDLPDDIPGEIRQRAEAELVGYAGRFDAQQLARLGQHILTVVAPEIGEARDAEALDRPEQQARRRRELFFVPDGQGTVHVRGRLTDEAAAIVRAALDPLAAPLPRTADGP
ncbi:MAG: 13E12 repeat family protein, partial [Actinomycetota bacterium]|nr:13E12 repeat family protein [Actinomycetota bacterium]